MKLNKFTNKLAAVLMSCLMVANGLMFTACDSDDDNDGSAVVLSSFGPCPALRGGELRFIGKNLDKVTSIQLPGTDAITAYEVVDKREIKISVPQDATPGYINLEYAKGTITTKTQITYEEPISITSFAPASLKAGQVLTINGDYLNLIKEVIFPDNVVVNEFKSQTRAKIELIVPAEAQSGKFRLSNGAEIPIEVYADADLTVAEPAFVSVTPSNLKAGGTLTIKAINFDLVSSLILPGCDPIEIDQTADTYVIDATPANIQAGALKFIAKSGIEILSEPITLVLPEITSISSAAVKNNTEFTINGKNLDLVSGISFLGVSEEVTTFTSQEAAKIVLTLPATATDGAFTLNTLSDTHVDGQVLTFAQPKVNTFSTESAKAGENITLKGENLDLVAKVIFGAMPGTIVSATNDELVATVPVGAESGALTLVTINNTQVQTTQTLTINVTLPTITSITAEGPGKKITITGSELSLIKTIYFADENGDYTIKCTDYGVKSDALVEFYHVAESAKGTITPKMVTFDGDEGFMPAVWCNGVDPIVDESLIIFDFDKDGNIGADGNSWDGVGGSGDLSDGISGSYYEIQASNWAAGKYWWFAENWVTHATVSGKDDYNVKFDLRLRNDVVGSGAEVRLMLAGDVVNILPYIEKNGAYTTGGSWITVTIPLSSWAGLSDPTPAKGGEWGIAVWDNGLNFTGFCIDNIRYEHK